MNSEQPTREEYETALAVLSSVKNEMVENQYFGGAAMCRNAIDILRKYIRPKEKVKRLRPYNAEELHGLIGMAVKCKNRACLLQRVIACVSSGDLVTDIQFANINEFRNAEYLLDNWEHLDGSPCGVEEEVNFPGETIYLDEPECDCDCIDTAKVTITIEPEPTPQFRLGWLRWLFIGAGIIYVASVWHWNK